MKIPFVAACASLVLFTGLRASSLETAILAAMQLSEEANYSWNCSITDDAGTYEIEGKTVQGGYTWQRQPMPKVIARRLGRGAGYDLEAIFAGPQQYVIHTEDGWRKLEELPKRHRDWIDGNESYFVSAPLLPSPEMPADLRDMDPLGLPRTVYIQLPGSDDETDNVYSNAQFALALPHEQLAIIVSSYSDLDVSDHLATGTLTDLGAQLLLVHDGHEYIRPVTAGGRFKLWLNAGRVEKYSVELAGVVLVDRRTIYVRQTSTTRVSAIGTTSIPVPVEARRRL